MKKPLSLISFLLIAIIIPLIFPSTSFARTPYNALAATLKSDTTTGVFNESDPLVPNTQVTGTVRSKNGSTFMVRLPKDDEGYNILITKETEITLNGKKAILKNITKGAAVTVTGILDTATYTIKADKVELGKSVSHTEKLTAVAEMPEIKSETEQPETIIHTSVSDKISKTLKQGAKNSDVKKLQDKLVKLGYLSKEQATGYYGPMTTKAVKAFQKANNLDQVGSVGTKTLTRLNK